MTKARVRSTRRTALLRVVKKTLVGIVHHTLVLLRVLVEQVPALQGTIILVVSPDIDLLSFISNQL